MVVLVGVGDWQKVMSSKAGMIEKASPKPIKIQATMVKNHSKGRGGCHGEGNGGGPRKKKPRLWRIRPKARRLRGEAPLMAGTREIRMPPG